MNRTALFVLGMAMVATPVVALAQTPAPTASHSAMSHDAMHGAMAHPSPKPSHSAMSHDAMHGAMAHPSPSAMTHSAMSHDAMSASPKP
jgi:hypothetical protein